MSEDAAPRRAFGSSGDARYHNELRRKVLDAHPEAASLVGPDWRTTIAAVFMLALYWTIAWAVSRTNWWVVFLAAFFLGQTIYHSVGVLVHENAHRLVFRNPKARLAYDLLTETILTSFGAQLVYQHNHVTSHHAHLGDYETDYEHEDAYRVAARRAYRAAHPVRYRLMSIGILIFHLLPLAIITDTMILPRLLGKAEGLPSIDKTRNTGATRPTKGELRLFALYSLAVNVFLFWAFGFYGWLFHVWSFSLVLSRWGASIRGQILSEHFGTDDHPTRSTYWPGNFVFYNIGYHVEHHSFPNIPWMKLPKLTAMAPEYFNLNNPHGYYGWWWRQVKSDFTLPRRASALKAEDIVKRRAAEAPPQAEEASTSAIAA